MKIIPNNRIRIGLKFRWYGQQYKIYDTGMIDGEDVWFVSKTLNTWIKKDTLKQKFKEKGKMLGYENITQ